MFKKAIKNESKLRLAIYGPAGSGKTFSALAIASGISNNIGVIDTERGSAKKYADLFSFQVCELSDKTIKGYCAAIADAKKAGIEVLIIDSLSHSWQELLVQVDKIATTKFRGNSWSAWSEGNPMQQHLIDEMLSYPGHIIGTMRVKTEWIVEKNDNQKSVPRRVGTAPEQGKGIEYEFDVLMEINQDHHATVIKSRISDFQDMIIEKPGIEFGTQLKQWISSKKIESVVKVYEHKPTQTPTPTAPPAEEAPGIDVYDIPTVTKKDFEPVQETDFDFGVAGLIDEIKKAKTLTDLTILYNSNNVGKSWKPGSIFKNEEELLDVRQKFSEAKQNLFR
jgi:hypothetical protein